MESKIQYSDNIIVKKRERRVYLMYNFAVFSNFGVIFNYFWKIPSSDILGGFYFRED